MPRYQFCNRTLDSAWALNLPASDRDPADFRFEVGPLDHSVTFSPRPFLQHDLPDGTVWVAFYHLPNGFRIHFPTLADFHLSADGRVIRCAPDPGVPDDTIDHLLLDQVLPRALSHAGVTVLHASAVAIDGRAIAFLGDTGWGKSTLTAGLCASGLALVSDDCLAIVDAARDPIIGVGSYPGIRLWPDSVLALGAAADQAGRVAHYSRKRRIAAGHERLTYHDGPIALQCLYLLAPPDADPPPAAVVITPVPARERVVRLLEYSFRLDVTDRGRSAREFLALTALADRLPMYHLRYPRRYEALPDIGAALRAHSRGSQQHGR